MILLTFPEVAAPVSQVQSLIMSKGKETNEQADLKPSAPSPTPLPLPQRMLGQTPARLKDRD